MEFQQKISEHKHEYIVDIVYCRDVQYVRIPINVHVYGIQDISDVSHTGVSRKPGFHIPGAKTEAALVAIRQGYVHIGHIHTIRVLSMYNMKGRMAETSHMLF